MKAITLSRPRRSLGFSTRARIDNVRPQRLQIRNVLVPVDFSAPSLEAIAVALPLLKQFGAQLHLVHVFPSDYPLVAMAAMPLIIPELETGRTVRRQLKDLAKQYQIELGRGNIHAIKGQPFQEICELARKIDIDLIVLSTHGYTGLKHLALGSTAERVVRYSPCPVMVVRGDAGARKAGGNGKAPREVLRFRKIIVPIDFSDCSLKGLAYAKALARQFRSTLVLLHSVQLNYFVTSDGYVRYDFPLLMQQAEKAARSQMRNLVTKTDWQGIKIETALEVGHPGQQICDRARDRHADLIVTSTHGLTGLKHIFIGSTAEYVVRHARCPVLVVPSHGRPTISPVKKHL
jgi:nucleotide-binding universal stress UspA family protein